MTKRSSSSSQHDARAEQHDIEMTAPAAREHSSGGPDGDDPAPGAGGSAAAAVVLERIDNLPDSEYAAQLATHETAIEATLIDENGEETVIEASLVEIDLNVDLTRKQAEDSPPEPEAEPVINEVDHTKPNTEHRPSDRTPNDDAISIRADRASDIADTDQPVVDRDDAVDPDEADDADDAVDDTPPLELRQIAGLTAGTVVVLEESRYEFAEGDKAAGFGVELDEVGRVVVVPGSAPARIDTAPVTEPSLLGFGALDVGSARFVARPPRPPRRAVDWLDTQRLLDDTDKVIDVPDDLPEVPPATNRDETSGRRRRLLRRRSKGAEPAPSTEDVLDAKSWEFVEQVRQTRTELAERERYLHPDPAELAERAQLRAPILGERPPGHPLFAKVGMLVADMPWMPEFSDIKAIPDSLGSHLQPLMSLPSMPIPADLMVGPLGIVGSRAATRACARHALVSLYALSTGADFHVVQNDSGDVWDWAFKIAPCHPAGRLDLQVSDGDDAFPIVVLDSVQPADAGISEREILDLDVGVVVLADTVEDLPPYCGTVLQIDDAGLGRLTNDQGHVITGTPVGITTSMARTVAADLHDVIARRRTMATA